MHSADPSPWLLPQAEEGMHVLLMTLHHTVTDGWSTSIICSELSAAYNSFAANRTPPDLPPLAVQYGDFAAWQRRCMCARCLLVLPLPSNESQCQGSHRLFTP